MTLQEYFNQENPVRMPVVNLTKDEYTKGVTIKRADGVSLTQIFIDGLTQRFNVRTHQYIQKNGESRLYTTTEDGNVGQLSCFHI